MMSLLPSWALNISIALLSMGQKALGFHQKYLNLCSEDERRCLQVWNDMTEFSFLGELSL